MDKKLFDKMYKMCCDIASKNEDLKYVTGRSPVGAVIVAESGKVYTGLNIGWWHSTCAEVTALSNAWQAGEREFKYVMAVKLNKRNGDLECITPCGICREMFSHLQPEIHIVHKVNDEFVVSTIVDLLPYGIANDSLVDDLKPKKKLK